VEEWGTGHANGGTLIELHGAAPVTYWGCQGSELQLGNSKRPSVLFEGRSMNRIILYAVPVFWVLAFIWQTVAHAQHVISHGILDITGYWNSDGDIILIDENVY
jgi:hypothetical protein